MPSPRFQKGQSGNPHGRPKEFKAFKESAREFMDREGLERLLGLARDDSEFALKLLAEYAYGKPTQPIEQSGMLTVEHLDSSTVDQALEYAARRRGLRAVS
jgi:hypothetical protein